MKTKVEGTRINRHDKKKKLLKDIQNEIEVKFINKNLRERPKWFKGMWKYTENRQRITNMEITEVPE